MQLTKVQHNSEFLTQCTLQDTPPTGLRIHKDNNIMQPAPQLQLGAEVVAKGEKDEEEKQKTPKQLLTIIIINSLFIDLCIHI